ncbi:MAG TPA: acyltransferase family protein [Xanthobacteraceae bacterium]|nr:acyltransferase family protein [Xanthobacteraceae bacterium]
MIPATGQNRIAHIDGLRAIAVLAVVAFHANIPFVTGGFIGVDVFFVISGYLIVNHIVQELAAGKFSFAQFYARRALRLFPPLFVMLIVTTLAAAVILVSPYEWQWYVLSAVTSAVFASNFYFLSKQGYFDIDAYEKPLLHTWSLSVEEQFYLVVPLLLFLCFVFARRRNETFYRVLAIAGALVFVVSLIGCILQTPASDRNYAFYLMHWRAWEFAAGGAIGFVQNGLLQRLKAAHASALAIAGLLLIGVPLFVINETMRFPGWIAIFPVLGTVLMIAAGFANPNVLPVRLISSRAMTFVGLVSYSWYLWHWPMISLARIAQYGDPSLPRDLLMAALSFGLAVVTFYLVEKPARRMRETMDLGKAGLSVVVKAVVASVALAMFCGAIGGFAYWKTSRDPIVTTSSQHYVDRAACPDTICKNVKGQRGILIGDSHSDRLEDALVRETRKHGATLTRSPQNGGDFAIINYRWNPLPRTYLGAGAQVEELLNKGVKRILLIGPVPEFRYKAGICLFRAQRYGESPDRCSLPRAEIEAYRRPAMAALQQVASKYPAVRLIDPLPAFCNETLCRPYENGATLYRDDNHLSVPYGADRLYFQFRQAFWWALSGNESQP